MAYCIANTDTSPLLYIPSRCRSGRKHVVASDPPAFAIIKLVIATPVQSALYSTNNLVHRWQKNRTQITTHARMMC